MTWLRMLLACGGAAVETSPEAAPDTSSPTTPPTEPSPWIYEEDSEPVAEFDAEALEAAVQSALFRIRDTTAAPVLAAYGSAMQGQGDYCPDYYAGEDGSIYWFDYCTSEYGTSFNGYAFSYDYVDYPDGSGYLYNGDAVFSAATIETADGRTFSGAGTAYGLIASWPVEGEAHKVYYTVLEGSFEWNGAEAEGTWIEEGVNPDLSVQLAQFDDYPDIRVAYVVGGVTGLDEDFDTVVFDDVALWDEALTTSGCEAEPSGSVSIRSPDGDWYDVLFDGPIDEEAEVVPGTCDGCGTAWFRGEQVGAVCADFSELLGWENTPW